MSVLRRVWLECKICGNTISYLVGLQRFHIYVYVAGNNRCTTY